MTLIANVILALALFPYLSPVATSFDTQPYALLAAAIAAPVLIASDRRLRIPGPLWILLGVALYALLVYFIDSDRQYGLRSLAGYLSVFLLALVGYRTYRHIDGRVFLASVAVWLGFGVLQLFTDLTLVEWLTTRSTTGATRGVTSLAVEPSYYAIVCVFLLLLNEMLHSEGKYGHKTYIVVVLALLFQMLISYSVTGLLLVFIFAGAKLISFISWKQRPAGSAALSALLVVAVLSVLVALALQADMFSGIRAGNIAMKVSSDPLEVLQTDESIADRTSHVVLSFHSLAHGNGLGLGLGTWQRHADALVASSAEWVQALAETRLSVGSRIMSGWGTAVFELGVVGVLFIATTVWLFAVSVYRTRQLRPACIISMVVVLAVMTMSVPLAFPLFGYLLGVHLYYGYADPRRRVSHQLSAISGRGVVLTHGLGSNGVTETPCIPLSPPLAMGD